MKLQPQGWYIAWGKSALRIFKTKAFARFARKERIDDAALWQAIADAGSGLVDADLGGGVIKQRIARKGQGKRSGYRAMVLYRAAHRAVFVSGFAKKDRDNISDRELAALRESAVEVLTWSEGQVARLLAAGAWVEIEKPKER